MGYAKCKQLTWPMTAELEFSVFLTAQLISLGIVHAQCASKRTNTVLSNIQERRQFVGLLYKWTELLKKFIAIIFQFSVTTFSDLLCKLQKSCACVWDSASIISYRLFHYISISDIGIKNCVLYL